MGPVLGDEYPHLPRVFSGRTEVPTLRASLTILEPDLISAPKCTFAATGKNTPFQAKKPL
jgi:hypothetical protein